MKRSQQMWFIERQGGVDLRSAARTRAKCEQADLDRALFDAVADASLDPSIDRQRVKNAAYDRWVTGRRNGEFRAVHVVVSWESKR